MTPTLNAALWGLFGAASVGAIGAALYRAHLQKLRLGGDLALLQGAVWNLVRGMENYPRRSASKRNKDRLATIREFAFQGAALGRPLPMSGESTLDITEAATEAIDRNERDSSGHWRTINAYRRPAYTFLALYRTNNITAARLSIVEHMKVQSKYDPGALPNFTELKMLFGLPTEHPTWEVAEAAERRGMSERRYIEIGRATAQGFTAITRNLVYVPWPEGRADEAIPEAYEGEALLDAMREFIR